MPPAGTRAQLISEIAAEIAAECQVTTLKAHRLARGWTVPQTVDAFHRMCRRERITRGLTVRSWMDWEAGDRPSWDYQDLVARLFHASPVHLGWAADYSSNGATRTRGSVALMAAAAPARTAVIEKAGGHDGRRRSLVHLPPDIGDFTGRADPADVLAGFLRELGVDGGDIPEGIDERARMYRAQLAGQRVLVVLDDAADESQVRPLLPGSAGCAVLVTSRSRLSALAGSHCVSLGTLPPEQATGLLAAIIGTDRAAAEPEAAAEIARLCGYLPLALRIAGA